jgi:cytoskeletal protein RodZ
MQTIGERLEEARKRKGISIREAAEGTKIRGDYLHKFEGNQYDINLPEIYVRGFLSSYARYLHLPAEKIVADYKALGSHEPRTRPVSRELYGRMDLSVSSAKDLGAREPDAKSSGSATKEEAGNPATFQPGTGSPVLDRALLVKGGIILGGALVLILIIVFSVRTLTGDSAAPTTAAAEATNAAAVSPAARSITLVALDTVRIKLVEESTNRELFQGTLVRGESRPFTKTGSLLLTASALESIEIEMNGRRFPTGETGYSRIRIQ